MKLLVTGGAGYVGSALVPRLVEAGHEVRLLDDFNLSSPRNLMGGDVRMVEFVRGDVRDSATVEDAVNGVDAIIHLAAITGAGSSHEQRERVLDINVEGTRTVVEAAEEAGVGRIVLASSCNVYGDTCEEEITEETEPQPGNPYAESKLAAEEICAESDLETVSLRLATNFGHSPGVRFNLVVNSFVFRALTGEPLTIYGDGRNWRPYLHVQDTARAFEAALEWAPGTYNVGWGNARIEEVVETVSSVLDVSVEMDYLRDRDPGPSYHVRFDRMEETGFTPNRSLEEGIQDLATQFTTNATEVSIP